MGSVRIRLSVMMFLQYAIWGVWAPTLSLYLARLPSFREAMGDKIGWIYLAMPLANILSPFVAGQLADRYFATQRFLAVSHLVGGLFILAAAYVADFTGMFWLILGHCLLYAPTVALTNALAFHHLPNGEKDFGAVRLWGTIGWIAIGWVFGAWLDWVTGADVGQCLFFAGILSIVMAAYCLTLPHTPPATKVESPLAFLEALKLVRKPSFAVMLVIALLVSTELQFYYALTQNFFADTPGPSLSAQQVVDSASANAKQAALLMRLLDTNGDNKLHRNELSAFDVQISKFEAIRRDLADAQPTEGATASDPKKALANQDQIKALFVKEWKAGTRWPLAAETVDQLASEDAGHLIAAVDESGAKQVNAEQIGAFLDQVRPLDGLAKRELEGFDAHATDRGGLGLSQAWAIRVLTIGQFVEIGVLALLPFALKKIGFTWTIGLGIAAWAVRYAMFAFGQPLWAVIASQTLHGFGFGFFFAGCMIYSDRVAPKDVRASAQSLFLLVTYGVGMLISSLIAGRVYDYFDHDWHETFLVPVAILVVCTLAFLIAFRAEPAVQEAAPGDKIEPEAGDLFKPSPSEGIQPPASEDVLPPRREENYM
jgi:MFS family permease